MAVTKYVIGFHPGEGTAGDLAYELRERGALIHKTFHVIRGFSASFDDDLVAELLADPRVKYVEADEPTEVEPLALNTETLPNVLTGATVPHAWQLDRIAKTTLPLDGTYTWRYTGAGTRIYLVDSGCNAHTEFGSRLVSGWTHPANPEGDPRITQFPHGIFAAGCMAGSTVGVARDATIVNIQYGWIVVPTTAQWIELLDWVLTDYNTAGQPAVMNCSFAIDILQFHQSIEDAWRGLVTAGITMVVAAGNNQETAPNSRIPQTLATYGEAIICGASSSVGEHVQITTYDRQALLGGRDAPDNYSARGAWVDIWAPSHTLTTDVSALWGADPTSVGTGFVRSSMGTSFAAPMTAGVVACLLEEDPTLTPAQVKARLLARAAQGVMQRLNEADNNVHLTNAQNLYDETTRVTFAPTAATTHRDASVVKGNWYRYRIRRGEGLIKSDWSEVW